MLCSSRPLDQVSLNSPLPLYAAEKDDAASHDHKKAHPVDRWSSHQETEPGPSGCTSKERTPRSMPSATTFFSVPVKISPLCRYTMIQLILGQTAPSEILRMSNCLIPVDKRKNKSMIEYWYSSVPVTFVGPILIINNLYPNFKQKSSGASSPVCRRVPHCIVRSATGPAGPPPIRSLPVVSR